MTTNKLVFTDSKIYTENGQKYLINVNIKLSDDCKNGHEDFSITGEIYEILKNGRKREYAFGAIHEDILKHFPEYKIFIDLHLCDFNGATMYTLENGFYNLKNLNKDKFINYFNINESQYNVLKNSVNSVHFAFLVYDLELSIQWREKALKAIEVLEEKTGSKFESKATKQHLNFNLDIINKYRNRDLNEIQREEEQKEVEKNKSDFNKYIQNLKNNAAKKINEINLNLEISLSIADILNTTNNNFIFYNHTQTLVFNWSDSNYRKQFTPEEVETFILKYSNPNNIKIEAKYKK